MVGFLCITRAHEHVSVLLACKHALLPVPSWQSLLAVIGRRFYDGLVLSGGSISDFRPNFCFALEVLTSMFVETDDFYED
jgi:hypothetical protein